ncbi:MAG TPA: helix-turn-helix domain-containing protein [Bacillales bacterium]|nr:helix-turn-helix domain-containing protein [Bacillales bacterium]
MITEIGKELRKLRIDHGERLLDMAKNLSKSSAFISAVERGTKSPPEGFVDLVARTYKLADDAAASLRRAADRSRSSFTLEAESLLARDTAGLMARRMNSLSEEELNNILQILGKKGTE